MANALQDQLLKAGLVNDKQLKKAQKEKRKAIQQTGGQKPALPDSSRVAREQADQKAQRDRELNRQRQEANQQKALAAQVRQLVEAHRVATGDGDLPYQFADQGRVKRLYVVEPVRRQIVNGRLAIVRSEDRYDLVPAEVAEKIRSRSPAEIVLWNEQTSDRGNDTDQEYAQYTVPDDLIW